MDEGMVASFTLTRAGTLHSELERRLSQSVSEALSTAASGTTFLALCDEEGGITRRFVSSGDNARNRAFRLATSLNASSTPDDAPTDLFWSELRRLAWVPGRSSVESETQTGTALQAVADAIDANALAVRPPLLRSLQCFSVAGTPHMAGQLPQGPEGRRRVHDCPRRRASVRRPHLVANAGRSQGAVLKQHCPTRSTTCCPRPSRADAPR